MFSFLNCDPVTKADNLARDGGYAFARHENADEVQRIGGGKRDSFLRGWQLASCTQRFDGDWQSKLFADESVHKAAAANLAAVFDPATGNLQLPPLGQIGFAGEQVAEDDSVTFQEHPAGGLDRPRPFDCLIGVEQRPAAGTVPGTRAAPAALSSAAFGIDE